MEKLYNKAITLSSTYSVGNIAQALLSFLLIPLYTTYLHPRDYGILALMNLTIQLVTKAISSPIAYAFGRFYYKPGYKHKSGILLFNLFSLLIIKTIGLAVLYWYLSGFLCRLLFGEQELIYIVRVYTILLLIMPASSFLQSFIMLREMAGYYVLLSLSSLVLSSGLIIYLLIGLKLGVLGVIYGQFFGLSLISAMCIPVFVKYSKFKISVPIIKEPLKFGYPQILSGYSNLLIQSGDRYVLRMFDPISTVGLYSFGYKICSVLNLLLVEPLKWGLQPVILKKEDNPKEQKVFLVNSANYYYLIAIFIVLGLSIFSREAIMVLARRQEFWACWVIVPIIAFSYVQHGLGNFVGWGIVMKNKPYHISGNLLVAAFVNIALNFVFIPYWGMVGAAFATLISYVIWNALKIYYSAKFYDLHFDLDRLGHITIVSAGLYLLSLLVASGPNIYLNTGAKTLIVIAYPILLLITGFFSRTEKEYMKKFFFDVRANGILATVGHLRVETGEAEERVGEVI